MAAITSAAAQTQNIRAFQTATKNIHLTLAASQKGVQEGLARFGVRMVSELRREVSHAGSGVVYRRRSVEHQASAPGQPPAVDRGRLRASFAFQVGPGFVDVGTNVEYAAHLEFGTVHMLPRPYFRTVVLRQQGGPGPDVARAIVKAEQREIGKLAGRVRTGLGAITSEAFSA